MDFIITAIDGYHREEGDVALYKKRVKEIGEGSLGLRVTADMVTPVATYFGLPYQSRYIFYCEAEDESKYHLGDVLTI